MGIHYASSCVWEFLILCFLLHIGPFSGKHLNLKVSIFDAFKAILKLFLEIGS